ncbi:LysR family transcriptional regulator [Ureibacillus terrenus]|uniref:LysR family transcriptional regulator n=1 Tax=Ureibacillus terrenus TaxID=118246 RepID=UPI002E241CB5|nr:LysR family transcriptional regulator [Ureibacillus terrenus]
MDIRQLRYFVTVAEEGQITRAARKLNMAQPPLSQQLKSIEEELGTTLFYRNSRNVELTEAGALLYKRAVSILHQLEDALVEVKETGDGLRGMLSLGASKSCALNYLPDRIKEFRNKYPLTTFKILDGHPYQVVKFLEERLVEMAVVRFASDQHLDFESKTLKIEPYVLFVPKQWNWDSGRGSISMKELEGIPLITVVQDDAVYNSFYDLCLKQGIKLNIIGECHDAATIFSLVSSGLGATVMPQSTYYLKTKLDIQIVEIEDCTLYNKTSLIWDKKRPLSKVAQRFIEMF